MQHYRHLEQTASHSEAFRTGGAHLRVSTGFPRPEEALSQLMIHEHGFRPRLKYLSCRDDLLQSFRTLKCRRKLERAIPTEVYFPRTLLIQSTEYRSVWNTRLKEGPGIYIYVGIRFTRRIGVQGLECRDSVFRRTCDYLQAWVATICNYLREDCLHGFGLLCRCRFKVKGLTSRYSECSQDAGQVGIYEGYPFTNKEVAGGGSTLHLPRRPRQFQEVSKCCGLIGLGSIFFCTCHSVGGLMP